ncbi:MAG: hypothetical protein JRI25_29090 [Deltaproteobacteria bacterium]|nr:hypothetical protein [Deltaproteobacteria bacterium]
MGTRTLGLLLPLAICAVTTGGCDEMFGDDEDPEHCYDNAEDLAGALGQAQSGDTIAVCGEIRGSFEVGAGVHLVGEEGRLISEGGAALRLVTDGGQETSISNLSVAAFGTGLSATAAIIATGMGTVRIESTSVEVGAGYGLVIDGISDVTLRDVRVAGTADIDSLVQAGNPAYWHGQLPEAGVVIGGRNAGTQVHIENLEVSGFVGIGVALYNTSGIWHEGGVRDSWILGAAIERAWNGITLENVLIEGISRPDVECHQEFARGLVVTDGSHLVTSNLSVVGTGGVALLQDQSTGTHQGLRILGNEGMGILVQRDPETMYAQPSLALVESEIARNRGAGVGLNDVHAAVIRRSAISQTRSSIALRPGGGIFVEADGITGAPASSWTARGPSTPTRRNPRHPSAGRPTSWTRAGPATRGPSPSWSAPGPRVRGSRTPGPATTTRPGPRAARPTPA